MRPARSHDTDTRRRQLRAAALPVLAAVVIAAVALAAAAKQPVLRVSAADDSSSTTTVPGPTTSTTAPPPPPPAPAGFQDQVISLYGDIYGVVQATGAEKEVPAGQGQLPTPDQYSQLVGQLTADQLADIYQGTQQQASDWANLPATYQELLAEAQAQPPQLPTTTTIPPSTTTTPSTIPPSTTLPPAAAKASAGRAPTGAAARTTANNSSAAAGSTTGTTVAFPPTPPVGSFPPPPPTYVANLPVGPAPGIQGCPDIPPGADYGAAGILGATLAAQTLDDIEPYIPEHLTIPVSEVPEPPVFTDVIIPDPALIVVAIAAGAAHVIADTLNYEQLAWTNCNTDDAGFYLANIDNTTVNTYNLLTLTESTLDTVENSINTVSGQVHTLQQSADDQLTLGLEQALSAPLNSAPNAAYETPASEGGNLNSQPIGVQELVTAILAEANQAGVSVNPIASRHLAEANAALSGGNYRQAYSYYHQAYVEAAQ